MRDWEGDWERKIKRERNLGRERESAIATEIERERVRVTEIERACQRKRNWEKER